MPNYPLKKLFRCHLLLDSNQGQYTEIEDGISLKDIIEKIKGLYEKRIIEQFLVKNNYNKSKTARELCVTRKTLSKKIKQYGVF